MNIKKFFYMAMFFMSSTAYAEDWLCKEEASQRYGESVYSCGVASSKDESVARTLALDNAKIEFDKVCQLSSDCKNHDISVEPKRTSCDLHNKFFKCYRLLHFKIGQLKKIVLENSQVSGSMAFIDMKGLNRK